MSSGRGPTDDWEGGLQAAMSRARGSKEEEYFGLETKATSELQAK